jgi:hypothetical protein
MTLVKHTLIGIGAGAIFYPFYGINSLWFAASSVLIDIDHCFQFMLVTHFANFNPKTMFNYFNILLGWKHRKDMLGICMFHTLEFLGLAVILAFKLKSPVLTIISLGFIFHFICDSIFLFKRGMLARRASSFLEYFIRRHRMNKNGIDADRVFKDALEAARVIN